jgi:hypothetical protein
MDDVVFWLTIIVAIVFGVGASLFTAWTSHRRKELLLKLVHNERMLALEKGLPLPEVPTKLLGDADMPSAARSMRSGVALVLVGIVLYFSIYQFLDEDMALFGLIPAAVGVANLLYAEVLRRRKQPSPPDS